MTMIDHYNITVYGEHTIEPVIRELIHSRAMERLKRIHQHGPDFLAWPHANITRFEHSLGVMFLLKTFQAPLQEQVAGLLHDVSHGAFSHAIDFIYNNQLVADFADQCFIRVVERSDIPVILSKYDYKLEEIFQIKKYSLLERDSPDLCADRIDYFFRDSQKYGLITFDEIDFMLDAITVIDNEFIFKDEEAALLFGIKYLESAEKVFGSKESIFFHTMIAQALRIGIESGLLEHEDLFLLDDIQIQEKLSRSDNPAILDCLGLISDSTVLEFDEKNPDYQLRVKIRVVDPKVIFKCSSRRLSEFNEEFNGKLEESKNKQRAGFSVKVKSNNIEMIFK